ncbi:MAG: sulfite exporter TauE/SafE family protein [Candidatus Obscuribacterales bacterium]
MLKSAGCGRLRLMNPVPDYITLLKALPLGLAAGAFSGAFGVGGGVLSTPLLIMVIGAEPHVAVGTTLSMIIPTAVSGAITYSKKKLFSKKLAIASGLPAVVCTVLSSYLERDISGTVVIFCLAFLMITVGIDFATGIGLRLRRAAAPDPDEATAGSEPDPAEFTRSHVVHATIIGGIAGFLSGFLGIGGGFILIPLYCYLFHTPIKVAFGTSLLVVGAVALPGAIIHACYGHVDLPLALALLVGSVPGAKIGSHFSTKSKDDHLRITFGVILIILAITFAAPHLPELIPGNAPQQTH